MWIKITPNYWRKTAFTPIFNLQYEYTIKYGLLISGSEILHQIRTGDEKAFETLFREYYARLCSYAASYVMEMDQAEEVVQELFFSLWEKREGLTINTSIEAYLFRSVRNACLNYLKHLKIRQKHATHVKTSHNPGYDTQSDPVETLELEIKIDQAVEGLPPERKKIFQLSRFEGLKYREIADRLGISVKTVEVQMGKALKHMRENLAEFLVIALLVLVEIVLFFIDHE